MHLWAASLVTISVRSCIACVLNDDSRSGLSIVAMSIGGQSSRLGNGTGMVARERGRGLSHATRRSQVVARVKELKAIAGSICMYFDVPILEV